MRDGCCNGRKKCFAVEWRLDGVGSHTEALYSEMVEEGVLRFVRRHGGGKQVETRRFFIVKAWKSD